MPIQRGDVVLCRVPMPSTGLTQFKLRPAVVVSKDVNNQRQIYHPEGWAEGCSLKVHRSAEL
ncbi:MAG: type II toxin-antitoxin system PemK/MazF family toxin [Anaerolineae bacterium]